MDNKEKEVKKDERKEIPMINMYRIFQIKEYLSTILTISLIYTIVGLIVCLINLFSELNLLGGMYIASILTMAYIANAIGNILKYFHNLLIEIHISENSDIELKEKEKDND